MQEIQYKISVEGKNSEKTLTTLKTQIIQLERELEKLQALGDKTEISFGKPNELKQTQTALAGLKSELAALQGVGSSINASFTEVTKGLNDTAGAFVGVVGQAAGLNTALQGTNEVLTDQVFTQKALEKAALATGTALKSETKDVNALKSTVAQPIKLDVTTNKEEIDKLIAGGEQAKEVLDNIEKGKVEVNTTGAVNSLGKLRKEVLSLQDELENTEVGTDRYKQLESQLVSTSAKLADLKDKTEDLGDAVRVSIGPPVERANKSFMLLRDGLANLDFQKISVALKGLKGAFVSAITPSEGFKKSLGDLGKGIIGLDFKQFKSGLDGVSTGFKGLGKAIISTGIGALVIGITTLIANFDELKKSGGLVGDIFRGIGDAIDALVNKFRPLLSALGVVDSQQVVSSNKTIENANKQAKAIEERYNNEIKVAEAAGLSVIEIEKKKTKELLTLALLQVNILKRLKAEGDGFSEDQQKQLDEQTKAVQDYTTALQVLNIQGSKEANKAQDEAQERSKSLIQEYDKQIKSAKNAYDLQLAIIREFEAQKVISADEANAQVAESNLNLVKKQLDALTQLANADGVLTDAEKNRIVAMEVQVKLREQELKDANQILDATKKRDEIAANLAKQLQTLDAQNIILDIKARVGLDDSALVEDIKQISQKNALLEAQQAELNQLISESVGLSGEQLNIKKEEIATQATSIANNQVELDILNKNLENKKELLKIQDDLVASQKLSTDEEIKLKALRDLASKGGKVGETAQKELVIVEAQIDLSNLNEQKDALISTIDNIKKQIETNNITILATPDEAEKAKLISENEQLAKDVITKTGEAVKLQTEILTAEQPIKTSILGGLFSVTEEQKQLLIDGALQLSQQISDAVFAGQQVNNERNLQNRLEAIQVQGDAELAAIDEQLARKEITESEAAQRKNAVLANIAKQEEAAKKAAFEREKKLKIAQATVELALSIFKIQAATAVAAAAAAAAAAPLGPIASAAAAAAQIAFGGTQKLLAAAGYAVSIASIAAQKYAKGGQVKYSEGGLAVGPTHAQGGIPGIVNNQRPIEFEGGEYIVRAAAVKKYGSQLFDTLNSMKFAGGGGVPTSASSTISDNFTSVTDFNSIQKSTPVVPLLQPTSNNVVYVSDINSAQSRLNRTETRTTYGN